MLATWRLSNALVNEAGPWWVLVRLRRRTGIVHDDMGNPIAVPDGHILGCVWCASVWVGLTLLFVPFGIVVVLATSAGAIIVGEKLT